MGLHLAQMSQKRFVLLSDMRSDNIRLYETLHPEFLNRLLGEIVFLDLQLLFSQQITQILVVLLCKVVSTLNDALNL